MANHTIYDPLVDLNSGAGYSIDPDLDPVTLGLHFYVLGGEDGWQMRGVRIWIPDSAANLSSAVAYLYGSVPGSSEMLAVKAFPTTLTENAWNEVLFDAPIPLSEYPSGRYYYAAVYLPDGGFAYKIESYDDPVVSASNSNLVAADGSDAPGNNAFRSGTWGNPLAPGPITWVNLSRAHYGLDVLVSDPSSASPVAPNNTLTPTMTGSGRVGDTLTTASGSWGGDPDTFAYQYERKVGVGAFGNISGATTTTYTPVEGDLGATIRCKVTATNEVGSTVAYSNQAIIAEPLEDDQQTPNTKIHVLDPNTETFVELHFGTDVSERRRFYPEQYGAKGDGKSIGGVSVSAGDRTLTSTDPNVSFTNGDVGKAILVRGAGANGAENNLNTTIAAVNGADSIELAVDALVTVSGERATYGTDDCEAIRDCVEQAVGLGQQNGSNYAEIILSAKMYVLAGDPVAGGPWLTHSQIPLPLISDQIQKFTLAFTGIADSTAWNHWLQDTPQKNGSILFSFMCDVAQDDDYGAPNVIGGPTPNNLSELHDAGIENRFSNLLTIWDGVLVVTPRHPSIVAVNLRHTAMCRIKSMLLLVDQTASEMNVDPSENDQGIAIVFPDIGNNDNVAVDTLGIQGYYWGHSWTDHLAALRIGVIYCRFASYVPGSASANEHGATIVNYSVEACGTIIRSFATGKFPIFVGSLHTETGYAIDFVDPSNTLYAIINYTNNQLEHPTKDGAENIRIIDIFDTSRAEVVVAEEQPEFFNKNTVWIEIDGSGNVVETHVLS